MTFTTATLCASFILFGGFNTTDPVNSISLICGFLIIFSGVYLLNLSREDPEGHRLMSSHSDPDAFEGIPTDGIAGFTTRRSMQARRSSDHGRDRSLELGETDGLVRGYDAEAASFGLADPDDDSDDDRKTEEERERARAFNRLSGSGRARVESYKPKGFDR